MNNKQLHLKTIRIHRKAVRKACFQMGIPWLGLIHDLSKYSKVEMQIAKWYIGTRSPHDEARDELGYSPSWYHHKNKNKHHWEYWLDFNGAVEINGEMYIKPQPVKMPYKYVIEMFCDFVGAGKAYNKTKWTVHDPLLYWKKACEGKRIMHRDSQNLFVFLLQAMNDAENEKAFYKQYRQNAKHLKFLYSMPIFNATYK